MFTRTRRKQQVCIKMQKLGGQVGLSSFLAHNSNSPLSKMALSFVVQVYDSDLQRTSAYFRNRNSDYVSMMSAVVCLKHWAGADSEATLGSVGLLGGAVSIYKVGNLGAQALCHPWPAVCCIHSNTYVDVEEGIFCPTTLASKHQEGWLFLNCT